MRNFEIDNNAYAHAEINGEQCRSRRPRALSLLMQITIGIAAYLPRAACDILKVGR